MALNLKYGLPCYVSNTGKYHGNFNFKDELKGEITTVVGAVLGKQQCWERTACTLGKRTKSFAAKDVFLM